VIRKRFPASRLARILGWTAVVTAWGTVAIAQVSGTGSVAADPAPSAPEVPADVVTETVPAPVPAMPDGGLVVIRYTPAPPPEPVTRVVTRVVERRVTVQAAPKPASTGS